MKMNDRVTQGFIAGVIGAIPQMVFTLTLFSLHLSKNRYLDFAAAIAFNHRPMGLFQSIVAEIVVWIFTGFLGIIFSLLLKHISSENLIFKACLVGIFTWLVTYALVTFFKVRPLYPMGFATSLTHFVGGIIWGLTMGWTYKWLNRKYGL